MKKMILGAAGAGITMLALSSFFSDGEKKIPAVQHFDLQKYLGKWYEIARMDFRFEKDLTQCTADYSLRSDGKVRVVNKGFDTLQHKWKESTGKAKFVGAKDEGRLKVSFFGPFYAAYNVVAVDEQYRYALVLGKSPKYMWILSRTKDIPESVKADYLSRAKALGVNTDDLVWTKQAD